MRMPRCAASGAIMLSHSPRISPSATGSSERSTVPDSTLARSRISLIRVSRWRPDLRMWLANSFFCASVDGSRSEVRIWAKPRMALSGVRSSWLMDDRKADLAWLALLACSTASASSALLTSSWVVRSCTRRSRSSFRRITSRWARPRCSASRAISRFEVSSARVRSSISASMALKESASWATSSALILRARRE